MDHTAPPISIRFSDILIVGGDVPWMHDSAAGLSITGHEHPGENVKGSLSMRNVVIRDTRGAGVRLTSKAADAATMWQADISNLTIQNCASAWPAPPPPPTTKEPHPCSMSAAPIVVNWFSNDVHLPWVPACWKNGSCWRHVPIEAVGGLHMTDVRVIDSHPRPFISTGSPTFANGTKYIEKMPQVLANITVQGVVSNTAKGAAEVACTGELGPRQTYQARGIALDIDCHTTDESSGSLKADDELVDYSESELKLPDGLSAEIIAAVHARLDSVRRRVPGWAAVTDGARARVEVAWGETAGPGSYELSEVNGTALLTVARSDEPGLYAGVGRLLRELRVEHRSSRAYLPQSLRVVYDASTALWPMRGHQLTTAHYDSVFKTWPEFQTYVTELAHFGTTQIELAHINLDCDPANKTDCKLPTQALANFSANLQSLRGVNTSYWWPINLCALPNVDEAFAAIPSVQSLLIEGGLTNATAALGATCAEQLRRHHPLAELWVAVTAANFTELTTAFAAVNELEYVDGLCANPMAPVPLQQYVDAAPRRFPVRTYPDICHAVHTQFPVPEWHWAWSVTHSRNPVIPLPLHAANIVRLYGKSHNIGFGAYSEGTSDDLNKCIWSLLSAEPETTTVDAVRQYSRTFFGSEHEEAATA